MLFLVIQLLCFMLDIVGRYTALLFLIELYKKNRIKIRVFICLVFSNVKYREDEKTELIEYV